MDKKFSLSGTDEFGGAWTMDKATPSPVNFKNFGLQKPASPSALNFGNFSLTEPGGTGFGETGFDPTGGAATKSNSLFPNMEGKWMEAGEFGLGVAKVGLGIYSALEQSKMNKFMRGYYGDQIALQKADFANNARSTNEALSERQARRLSARGAGPIGSAANQAGVNQYMDKWGVDETV